VVQALTSIGFRTRKGKLNVGSYELGAILDETQTFQDREAVHRTIPSQRRRARTYLVPEQTSVERRQQLLRAAERGRSCSMRCASIRTSSGSPTTSPMRRWPDRAAR